MWKYDRSDTLLKEYDDNNNLIHVEHISGTFEAWYEYDNEDRQIHYKDSDGEENWYEYYGNGKLKSAWYHKARNSEVVYQYDYDESGELKSMHQAIKQNNSYNSGIRGQQ